MSRYEAAGDEVEFEPGSNGQVLRNKPHIKTVNETDDLELGLLATLYDVVLCVDFPNRTLTVRDLNSWHEQWLGNVYAWAGQVRAVNVSKGEFPFAAASQIPKLLEVYGRECLEVYTPCDDLAVEELARAHLIFLNVKLIRSSSARFDLGI